MELTRARWEDMYGRSAVARLIRDGLIVETGSVVNGRRGRRPILWYGNPHDCEVATQRYRRLRAAREELARAERKLLCADQTGREVMARLLAEIASLEGAPGGDGE